MTGLMHHLILRQKNMDEVFARSVFVGWTGLIHLCQRGFVRLCEEAFVRSYHLWLTEQISELFADRCKGVQSEEV